MPKKKLNELKSLKFPAYCDFNCDFAAFSNPDISGACRKELSVWCTYFKRYNNKNNKCLCCK